MKSQLPFLLEGSNHCDIENGSPNNSSQLVKSHNEFSFEFHCHITSRHSSKVDITQSRSSKLSTTSEDVYSSLCEKSHIETFSDEETIISKDEESNNEPPTVPESLVSTSTDITSADGDTEIDNIMKLANNEITMIADELVSSPNSINLEEKSI